jgi:hypothetical protein
MELVEGETLSDRLKRAPPSLKEVLRIGQEIGMALAAAHERGVLHRDLKPANIRLTPEGRVKVLDFGLARTLGKEELAVDSHLSTATSPPSHAGAVLGTAPYMSPEQARGEEVDQRSDVWAFGCVLYEMLAGRRAFPGTSFSEAVAAILEREPDWGALPEATPYALQRLLRRCLKKERDERLHDAADAALELKELLAELSSGAVLAGSGRPPAPPRRRARRAVVAAAVVLGMAGLAGLAVRIARPKAASGPARQPRFRSRAAGRGHAELTVALASGRLAGRRAASRSWAARTACASCASGSVGSWTRGLCPTPRSELSVLLAGRPLDRPGAGDKLKKVAADGGQW